MAGILKALDGKKSWLGALVIIAGALVIVVDKWLLTDAGLTEKIGIPAVIAGAGMLGIGVADKVKKLTDTMSAK